MVTVLAVAASIAGAFIGSGALGGTAISEAAGGWLSSEATPLAPGEGAFRIWSVIYVGLAAYAIWQLTPAARASSRQRALRPWAMLSAALNAAWVWMVQLDLLVASEVVIIALLVALIRILVLMRASAPRSWPEVILTDGTFGLYLGWVCVATVANTAAGWALWERRRSPAGSPLSTGCLRWQLLSALLPPSTHAEGWLRPCRCPGGWCGSPSDA